jgi:hypothetical protein
MLRCRPNFFYASVLIFFHNVLQCKDELPDVPTPQCVFDWLCISLPALC